MRTFELDSFRQRLKIAFICCLGAKTKDGEDVVLVNPSKIPSKREFTGRREYDEIMESLFL